MDRYGFILCNITRCLPHHTKPLPCTSSAAFLFDTYVVMETVLVAVVVSGSKLLAVFDLSRMQLGLCLGAAQFGGLVASLLIDPITYRRG